jgi:putative protease
MAPAGSFATLNAALSAGADSIYFGLGRLNMRARAAKSFSPQDLKAIVHRCCDHGAECYLALNTVLYDDDLAEARRLVEQAARAGVSAVIATDLAAIHMAREVGLSVHMSTQTNISNIHAVRFFARYAEVMVLARELSLDQIAAITRQINAESITGPSGRRVRIELFVHGALCVAISGKCYMSLARTGHSANRGECLQSCRRSYRVIDEASNEELRLDNRYIMSPKDLCTIGFLDQLVKAGATVLKIEGRGRSPEYVHTVTRVYREALDALHTGEYTDAHIRSWTQRLETVFNRGFWHGGYYLGHPLGEWSGAYGSRATRQKHHVGTVLNYYKRIGVAHLEIRDHPIQVGDRLLIMGPTTGVVECPVESLYCNERPADSAGRGDDVTLEVPAKVRPRDKVYLWTERIRWQS